MWPRWPSGIGGATGQLLLLLLGTIAIIFYKLGTGELLDEWREGLEEVDDDEG